MDEKKKYFTSGEIADHCGINFNIVVRWANRGRIKFPWKMEQKVSLDEFIVFLSDHNFQSLNLSEHQEPTVLIIDDEINVVNSIGRVFSSNGFKIISANNGFRAGLLLKQESPLIITLDLSMDKISGFDFLKIIKELHLNQKVWIVVISGEPNEDLEKAIEMGADFYLRKPFSKLDLEKIIKKLHPGVNDGEGLERSSIRRAI